MEVVFTRVVPRSSKLDYVGINLDSFTWKSADLDVNVLLTFAMF